MTETNQLGVSRQTAEVPFAVRSLKEAIRHVGARNRAGWFGPNVGHSLALILHAVELGADNDG